MTEEREDEAPTGPEPPGQGIEPSESPDEDTPSWEGPPPEKDDGPRLIDPRSEVPGPTGF